MRLDLSTLNPPQRDAVLHEAGPLLVLAGAGSGKTRVIIYRIARLLADGVDPETILGLTFTNKAAKEMRERLTRLVGRQASAVHLSTFHSLGLTILKEEYKAAGLRRGFCIYDTGDQLGLVRELLRRVKVADRRLDVMRVLELILKTKRDRLDQVPIDEGDDYEFAALDLYPRYISEMQAMSAIDFDDLILKSQDVLGDPEVRRRWLGRYQHLLVDEYQDTSPDQLELCQVLGAEADSICAVGDDDQSIYAWRGAAADNILLFSAHFPGAKEVVLDQNYRSTGNVLAAANSVIVNNAKRKAKRLWSAGGPGAPVSIVACNDAEDEAAFVAETILQRRYDGMRWDDVAVLYRSNVQARLFEEALRLEHIPYRVVGGQSFFDKKEVKDAVAYLAAAYNPYDEISLRRIINSPPRGIGNTSIERLTQYGEAQGGRFWGALKAVRQVPDIPAKTADAVEGFVSLVETMGHRLKSAPPNQIGDQARDLFKQAALRDAILEADDAPAISQRRLENLDAVVHGLERFGANLRPGSDDALGEFLRNSALVRDPKEDDDEEKGEGGEVTLMTLHSAKGLEFPFVFFVGLEEDLLPHRKTVDGGGDLAEERRLCYVGITRAKKELWLCYARTRVMHGQAQPRTPSRFLQEIPPSDGVVRRERDLPPPPEVADAKADEFFAKMRAQLGIDE